MRPSRQNVIVIRRRHICSDPIGSVAYHLYHLRVYCLTALPANASARCEDTVSDLGRHWQ